MAGKKVRPKVRKHLGKKNPKVDVVDEWETMDIDRDEQERGLKRRERRWRDIAQRNEEIKKLEKEALKKADKIRSDIRVPRNAIEEIWLKYDFLLANVMDIQAHQFLDKIREHDVKNYNKLLNIFISPYMRSQIDYFIVYFGGGGQVREKIKLVSIVREYRKLKGDKVKIKIIHKGEEEYNL